MRLLVGVLFAACSLYAQAMRLERNTVQIGVDLTPPNISAVNVNGVTDVNATVNWMTDEMATTNVRWTATPYVVGATAPGLTLLGGGTYASGSPPDTVADQTSHSYTITSGLQAALLFYFEIISSDAAGNGSRHYGTFVTTN